MELEDFLVKNKNKVQKEVDVFLESKEGNNLLKRYVSKELKMLLNDYPLDDLLGYKIFNQILKKIGTKVLKELNFKEK
jgi:hypothetical protein